MSVENRQWFTDEKFSYLQEIAAEETLSLPPSSNLRNACKFSFERFRDKTFPSFINRFIEEIKEAFKQLDFWLSFCIFDPRKLPADLEHLDSYREYELEKLISWYGPLKSDTFKDVTTYQDADVEPTNFVPNGVDSFT